MKRTLKSHLGMLLYRTGLYKRYFRNKAVIVLFHRINDALRDDPISCTTNQFRMFCDFFKNYFTVVSLEDLLEKLERGADVSCHLVITFDDGYRDNHDIGAVELRKRNLPACFFIATNFIASDYVPWWDERWSIRSEWMSWNHVRFLHAQGFEIGAHTMNHVDLGLVKDEEAMREIVGSKERLAKETNVTTQYFSYPYGGIGQLTEENREIVRKLGFSCCLAAYGGTISPNTDPFYLNREAISSWYVSPYHFGYEILSSGSSTPRQLVNDYA